MDERIKSLVDFTKDKLSLNDYYLKRHMLNERVNFLHETFYALTMEWFPLDVPQDHPDLNPAGTVVVEIDIHRKKLISVIFVGEKSYANQPLLNEINQKNIIEWVEEETGLVYDQQFQLQQATDGKFYFQGIYQDIPTYPSSLIKITFDQTGKLILFTVQGHFPTREMVKEEAYTLSFNHVEQIAQKQMKCLQYPDDKTEQLRYVYGLEEIFITNSDQQTIAYQPLLEDKPNVEQHEIIEWQTPLDEPFIRQEVLEEEVATVEKAFANVPADKASEITQLEQEKCLLAVQTFLRQQYPTESAKWLLKTLVRQNDYILAMLQRVETDDFIFQRKLTVFVDAENYEAVNFIDNQDMIDLFNDYQSLEKSPMTKDEAFARLKDYITLEPVYVYDRHQQSYILCGKLDSNYAIDMTDGSTTLLSEII